MERLVSVLRGQPVVVGRSMRWMTTATTATGNRFLGFNVSNNRAEYIGLIEALAFMQRNNISCIELYIRGDSLLVVNQMTGVYPIRNQSLFNLYSAVANKLEWVNSEYVEFSHIDRYYNGEADHLANQAISSRSSSCFWD